jgi:ATP-dependent Lon protease
MEYSSTHKLILTTLLLESQLKIYKTALFHEQKLVEVDKWQKLEPTTTKDKRAVEVAIKQIESEFKKRIERAEKYNSEVLNDFLASTKYDKSILTFVDNSTDLYADFTALFVKAMSKVEKNKPCDVLACLLVKNDNGEFTKDGFSYNVLTK